jgi:hypothetical protein
MTGKLQANQDTDSLDEYLLLSKDIWGETPAPAPLRSRPTLAGARSNFPPNHHNKIRPMFCIPSDSSRILTELGQNSPSGKNVIF